MPLVKIIRHGQITLPAQLRRALDLQEGDYIVSGDEHLKSLRTYQGIKIIAPAGFLEILMEQKGPDIQEP